MQAWKRFGNMIGRHMAVISPFLVLAAVLFPGPLSTLRPYVPVLFAFITFQGSLGNDFASLAAAFRKPSALFATLFTASVTMPLLALIVSRIVFGSNPNLVTGIVLEFSVPVAVVSTMWIGMYDGDSSLGLATLLVSTVLSPLTIPLTLKVLLGASVEVDALGMVRSMVVQIALPALAATTLNHMSRGWGKRELSPVLSPAAKVMLILVIVSNSTGAAPYMRDLSPQHVGAIVFVGLFAAFGYFLGIVASKAQGHDRARAATTAFQCGLRNISSGAVIAAQYFPGEVMLPVIAGTLFQQILAAFTGKAIDRIWPAAEDGQESR